MEGKERIYEYDALRILACAMIVAMHSPMPTVAASGLLLSSVSFFTQPGIGLFFMLSGALLIPRGGGRVFLKQRFGKIAAPILVWTAFYLVLTWSREGWATDWWRTLLSIPLANQGHGVLWFMYTLAGLYLLTPILTRWLENSGREETRFYLTLWAVTLAYPLLRLVVEVNEGVTGLLYYFTGYAGYYVLGYYMTRYKGRPGWKPVVALLPVVVATPVALKLGGVKVDFYAHFGYLSLFCLVQTVAWFKAGLKWGGSIIAGERTKRVAARISNLAFGIYLVHIFIMRELVWKADAVAGIGNYALQCTVIFTLTAVLSVAAAQLLSLLPGGQYIVGYRTRLKR